MAIGINNEKEVLNHVHTCSDCQNQYQHPVDQPANCEICPLCMTARKFQQGQFTNSGQS
jgi:hypothetical protein